MNEQTKEQEKLASMVIELVKKALHSEKDEVAKNVFANGIGEMAREAVKDAQDSNKIYWKG